MKRTDTIIIGGGQAGLAMSRCLSDRSIDHVVLERGRVAERWRSERWDSLRLLSPNWQLRLPGYRYTGKDPDGFMSMPEVVRYFQRYAQSFSAPIETETQVRSVRRDEDEGYRVTTNRGVWCAPNVVIATGQCDVPFVPGIARGLSPRITNIVPTRYKNPRALPDGGVLVVGASASGVQLAAELARAGRRVTLAAGRHTRLPRNYRGRDIMGWLDAMGLFDDRAESSPNLDAARREPSLQLIGHPDRQSLDLGVLEELGVELSGRLIGADGSNVRFATGLADDVRSADDKLGHILDKVDRFIERRGEHADRPERPSPLDIDDGPSEMNLEAAGIRTVLFCTGFVQRYPWLEVPVLAPSGRIRQRGGITPSAGLFTLGLHWMRRRGSMTIDGVGKDAEELAELVEARLHRPSLAA